MKGNAIISSEQSVIDLLHLCNQILFEELVLMYLSLFSIIIIIIIVYIYIVQLFPL